MLQREHPGIAISVKTRQAIRTILNNARDVIHELKGGGLLDEAEAGKLESVKNISPCSWNTKTKIRSATPNSLGLSRDLPCIPKDNKNVMPI